MKRPPLRLSARVLLEGRAEGIALVLDEPLSLWGGLELESGRIIDPRHPQRNVIVSGRVLVMPSGRGSSSSSSILAEALRLGSAPRALLLAVADEILVLGALVARLLYDAACPVLHLDAADYARLRTGDLVRIAEGGLVEVRRPAALR